MRNSIKKMENAGTEDAPFAAWRAIRGSRTSAWLRVTNLTDKRFRYSAAGYLATTVTGPTLSEPRMVTFGLRYEF